MIILTGGAGFIGSVILSALNKLGKTDIWVVDSLGNNEKWKNLRQKNYNNFSHKNDFLPELESLGKKKIEAIIHMGACSSTTETNADYVMRNNFLFSKHLFDFSVSRDIPFIYASSAATYGDGNQGFSDNVLELDKLLPLNIYGYSKHLFDQYVNSTRHSNQVVGLKFFNVYGPNEYHKGSMKSVIYNSYYQILKEKQVRLFKSDREDYGHGEQKRDFIYVKDISKVIIWLLNNPQVSGLYNLGTGQARTWKDLANAVFAAMNIPSNIEFIELPDNLKGKYQYFTEADMQKLRASGYDQEFTSLEDGAKDYVNNYLEKSDLGA